MSKIKNRTQSFRARIKKSFESGTFSHENFFKKHAVRSKEEKSIMEMYETYLNFTRLEF